jgi:putative flippase GtrA
MTARLSSGSDVRIPTLKGHQLIEEGWRYFLSAAIALALDAGSYAALIQLVGVHYLLAAPIGFAIGVTAIYTLSTRWVFRERRFADRRWEFAVFVAIGVLGLLLNELIIFVGVEQLSLSYLRAKFLSAAIVFGFNFGARKLLLFTRR